MRFVYVLHLLILCALSMKCMRLFKNCFCCVEDQDESAETFADVRLKIDPSTSTEIECTLRGLAKKGSTSSVNLSIIAVRNHNESNAVRNPLVTPTRPCIYPPIYSPVAKNTHPLSPVTGIAINPIPVHNNEDGGSMTLDISKITSRSGFTLDNSDIEETDNTSDESYWFKDSISSSSNTQSVSQPFSEWTVDSQLAKEEQDHMQYVFSIANMSLFTPKAVSVESGSLKSTDILAQHFKKMERRTNYNWSEWIFEPLPLTKDENIRISMLISIHLQQAHMLNAQILDCFNARTPKLRRWREKKDAYMHIRQLIIDIPGLYKQRSFEEITHRIEESAQSFTDIMAYFAESKPSQTVIAKPSETITVKNKQNSLLFHVDDKPKTFRFRAIKHDKENSEIERDDGRRLYNKNIRRANYSELSLDDKWRTGKGTKWETHESNQMPLSFTAKFHFTTLQGVLRAIYALINDNGHILHFKAVPMKEAANTIVSVLHTVFPDINIVFHSTYYNALEHNWWIPSLATNPLSFKLFLHSRRSYWGKNPSKNMRVKLEFEQIIEYDPFDIKMKISLSDNCPPIQQKQMERLQEKIKMDYNAIISDYFEDIHIGDDLENNDKWLNDVFLVGSVIMNEINGTFGIINHYNGSGEMRDIRLYTRTIYRKFSILKGFGNITRDNIEKVVQMGKSEVTANTINDLGNVTPAKACEYEQIKKSSIKSAIKSTKKSNKRVRFSEKLSDKEDNKGIPQLKRSLYNYKGIEFDKLQLSDNYESRFVMIRDLVLQTIHSIMLIIKDKLHVMQSLLSEIFGADIDNFVSIHQNITDEFVDFLNLFHLKNNSVAGNMLEITNKVYIFSNLQQHIEIICGFVDIREQIKETMRVNSSFDLSPAQKQQFQILRVTFNFHLGRLEDLSKAIAVLLTSHSIDDSIVQSTEKINFNGLHMRRKVAVLALLNFNLAIPDINGAINVYYYPAISEIFVPSTYFHLIRCRILSSFAQSFPSDLQFFQYSIALEQIIRFEDNEWNVYFKASCTTNSVPKTSARWKKIADGLQQNYDELVSDPKYYKETVMNKGEEHIKWTEDLYLLLSVTMAELNGSFGIKNSYTGDYRFKGAKFPLTTTLWFELPITRFNDLTSKQLEQIHNTQERVHQH